MKESTGGPPGANKPSARSAGPPVTAPDGIVVYPIDLSPCANLALAEGDIQPGHTYGIHAHRTLEQVTYVLSGRIRAITHDPQSGQTHEIQAAAGESVITLPGHSLQFAAAGDTPARVLFITSPPYPADHSNTVTLDTHRPLTEAERAPPQNGGIPFATSSAGPLISPCRERNADRFVQSSPTSGDHLRKTPEMIRHLAGIAEIVDDLEAAVSFYRDHLGLEVDDSASADYASVKIPGVIHFGIWSREAAAEATLGDRGAVDRLPSA